MCTFLTLYKTNTVCQKIFYSLIETEAEQVPPPWKKLQLKLVTLTASSNTQTAHYQQNKNQDVPKKYPCCPQNICYTEYNQVYWLWKFIEFLQCFLEMRTVHCCSASNSTVCHVLLLHEKATEKICLTVIQAANCCTDFPKKRSSLKISQLIFIPVIQIHITEINVIFNWKLWKREGFEYMFRSA